MKTIKLTQGKSTLVDDIKRYDEVVTKDGYAALVLLCAGEYVTVWLVSANQLPSAKRFRYYKKSELL